MAGLHRIRLGALWKTAATTLCVLAIGGYPIVAYIAPAFETVDTTVISYYYRGAVLTLSLLLIVSGLKGIQYSSRLYVLAFVAFWTLYVLRLGMDAVPEAVGLRQPWEEYWLFAVGACLLPALAALTLGEQYLSRRTGVILVGALAIGGLLNAWIAVNAWPVGRLDHSALNPISLGHQGASLAVLTMAYLIDRRNLERRSERSLVFVLGMFVLVLVGVTLSIASASRGAVLALGMALLVLGLRAYSSSVGRAAIALTTVVVGTVLAMWLSQMLGGLFIERVDSVLAGTDVAFAERQRLWKTAWELFLGQPLLGAKLEITSRGAYPHNVLLEAYMALGLLGGTAFLALLIIGASNAVRLGLSQSRLWWLGALAVQYIVGALLSGSLYSNAQMWFLLSVCVAIVGNRRHRLRHNVW